MGHVLERPTHSARLRLKIELLLPALVAAGERLVAHPRARAIYPEYLVMSHWIVRASVPLMEAALERANALADRDPVAAGLAAYLGDHIPEELGHDEWLLDDIETLGLDRETVLARTPSMTVARVVGAQYYWILHHHPVAVLGYIALLEGYPPSPQLVDALAAKTGYGPSAFRTLRLHAELDPGHRDELDATLDGLPLTEAHTTAIGVSALHTVDGLTRSLDEVVREFGDMAG